MAAKNKILTTIQARNLAEARRTAQRKADVIHVKAHDRKQYRLEGGYVRLARWSDAERAILALMRMRERESAKGEMIYGADSGLDSEMAERLMCLLDDAFKPRNVRVVNAQKRRAS